MQFVFSALVISTNSQRHGDDNDQIVVYIVLN